MWGVAEGRDGRRLGCVRDRKKRIAAYLVSFRS